MIGFLKLILCFHAYFMVLNTAECQVTLTNLNGTDTFLCGYNITLECAIPGYTGGMNWQLNGTLIAQCAFGNCDPPGLLSSGDIFTYDETAKKFNLIIGITYSDNGSMYQCEEGTNKENTTVNIQVPPLENEFTPDITETPTSLTVEAGCFYPSEAGRMDVYCVSEGTEELLNAAVIMTSTTTGCIGNCSGPNTYTATGSYAIDDSNAGGTSAYRFIVYHKDFKPYNISIDSSANYRCSVVTTLPTTVTQTTSTSNTTEEHSTSPPTSSSTSPITTPPPGPDCGETCIIIIVVVVVGVVIFITIIIVCVRKRNKNEATKKLAENNDKNDQNNIPLGQPVPVA